MNDDVRHARVRVRREVMPALAAIAPDVEGALCRLAALAAEQDEALAAAAAPLVAAARRGDGLVCGPLAAAAPALARWLLAAWLRDQADVGLGHVEAVRRLCLGPARGTRGLDLPGLRVERVYDRLHATPRATAAATAAATTDELAARRADAAALTVRGPDGPYRVRRWQPGDRLRPARLRGRSRKLSDLFIDARIPRASRASARVVEDARGTIVWVEHLGPAHAVEVVVTVADGPSSDPDPR